MCGGGGWLESFEPSAAVAFGRDDQGLFKSTHAKTEITLGIMGIISTPITLLLSGEQRFLTSSLNASVERF